MKKLGFINKIIFLVNNAFAILLLLSLFIAYIRPSNFSFAPIIGLTIPMVILINVFFVIYWVLIGFRKQFLLSTIVLLLSLFFSTPIYKFSNKRDNIRQNEIKIMSYNVRKFNSRRWIADDSIPNKISSFIHDKNPDIVVLQEFEPTDNFSLEYPYKYNPSANKLSMSGLAIYSNYPIINQGKVDISKHPNRVIFADILINTDTLRIFNFHFQSLGLIPGKEFLGQKNSDGLIRRLRSAFTEQEKQLFNYRSQPSSQNKKIILAGDLNNTSFSWVYKNLKSNLQDSFIKAGKEFGKTYEFKGFPLRIDFVLVDQKLDILHHKNYDV
ncbi:MAG: endonuclease/exonuclease/phosphatase family protein, partial [Flavobacteriaceae bacterium]|nr:endonuclease/exonuclease/phosphatase family protein [Flavobacteriaceae bacterium]